MEKAQLKKLIFLWTITQLVLLASACAFPNTLTVTESGDVLAETDRYAVRFHSGIITYIENKQTEEIYTIGEKPTTSRIAGMHAAKNEYRISRANFIEVEKVAPLTAQLKAKWDEQTLFMWITIDPVTEELIVKQEGFSKGTSNIQWGFGNLDYDKVSLIVPGRGGKRIEVEHTRRLYLPYPSRWWQAPLAVLQGTVGGCFVMSRNEADRVKALSYLPDPGVFAVELRTDNFLPFEEHEKITSTIWYFNTYTGGWQVPAAQYRQEMVARNESRIARRHTWVKDIQLVVFYCSLNRDYMRMLDFLSRHINPQNVLIFCRGGWRQENFGAFVSAAKLRGFRIMFSVGFQFVGKDHPRYAEWEPYFYRTETGEIKGWEFSEGGPAYINPAVSTYRAFHVQALKDVQARYNIDAFHLDVNHFIANHEPIDGLTPIRGNMLLHEALIEAMPGIVFSGEFLHEVTSPYVALYARGDNAGYGNPHPITDFLFSQWSLAYAGLHSYLGQRHIPLENAILNLGIEAYRQADVIPTIRYHHEGHFEVQQAISIVHRTASNVAFWEELKRMVNTPYREDLNFDGVVNILDLVIVANAFGTPTGTDLNADNVVNILDLVIVANALGENP